MKANAIWFAKQFQEDEEVLRRRLTLTRHTGVRQTPKDKTGNKQDFYSSRKYGRDNVNVIDFN